tara:strand:+ start:2676 stop:3092 length:417 start_codon:yes stop_codon:yes gene_type:complete
MNKELKIAQQINRYTQLNLFENTRKREYVEARSLLCVILNKYFDYGLNKISKFFKGNNKTMHHATVLHLIRSFDVYKKYNKNLDSWLKEIVDKIEGVRNEHKRTLIKQRIKYLTNKDIDQLAIRTEDMYNKVLENENT